jgi:transposase
MPRAYSQDLRDRVIDAVVRGGQSRRAASRRFGVSEASAIKWVQRYERAGDRRCAGTGGHRPSKVKPERDWLLAVIAAEPDITLAALSARLLAERGVRADTGMLSRFFVGEGISFKKKRAALRAESARRCASAGELEALPGPA